MKYYITYPGNTEMPWLTDSTVTIEANDEGEALQKFAPNGYKNIRNCILVRTEGPWLNEYRHPMTALWEDSVVEQGKLYRCQEDLHWLQWVEKQTHPGYTVDQYSCFIPRAHNPTWAYRLAIFCCTCGVVVYKEEGESGIPEKPMVNWWVKKYINRPKTIHE